MILTLPTICPQSFTHVQTARMHARCKQRYGNLKGRFRELLLCCSRKSASRFLDCVFHSPQVLWSLLEPEHCIKFTGSSSSGPITLLPGPSVLHLGRHWRAIAVSLVLVTIRFLSDHTVPVFGASVLAYLSVNFTN
uniref:Uncharacterized protein n=1 Tax=Setaria digitata TaxID=48799 RepID=A0A915PRS3_9BILA